MISNSLSKRFPQVQLEQGTVRAGLEVGLRSPGDRFWFQAKGSDSFMSGDVYQAPGQDGVNFSAVDRDGRNDLHVTLETGCDAQLVINNGSATMRVDVGPISQPVEALPLSDEARVVFVETGAKGARIGVGQYANELSTYVVHNGLLLAVGTQDWNQAS